MPAPPPSLDEIRKEIDAIDDGLMDLLVRRQAATEQVRHHKASNGSLTLSPIRPAREAAILRRLLGRAGTALAPDLTVRLWRLILSASARAQAEIALHVPRRLAASPLTLRMLAAHFGDMPVNECRDEGQAMVQVNVSPGDLCVVDAESGWAEAFVQGSSGAARVIGVLPVLRSGDHPRLMVLGHAVAQPTGDDETVVVSTGRLPRDFAPAPVWQVRSGAFTVSGLPGFLTEHEGPLVGLPRSNSGLALRIAGQFPSQIEV
jgi:chorismate mutase